MKTVRILTKKQKTEPVSNEEYNNSNEKPTRRNELQSDTEEHIRGQEDRIVEIMQSKQNKQEKQIKAKVDGTV